MECSYEYYERNYIEKHGYDYREQTKKKVTKISQPRRLNVIFFYILFSSPPPLVPSFFKRFDSTQRNMRKPVYSLSRKLGRMSWNKYNLYNIAHKELPNFNNKTLFQQKWVAKRETRAYHGDEVTERQFKNKFLIPNYLQFTLQQMLVKLILLLLFFLLLNWNVV